MIHRVLSSDPFARVRKAVLEDKRMSWKAKGVFAYLMGKPDDWKGIVADIVNHGPERATAIRAAIKELVEFGYAREERIREKGKLAGLVIHVADDPTFFKKSEKQPANIEAKPRSGKLNVENLNVENLNEGDTNEANLREGNQPLNKNEKKNKNEVKAADAAGAVTADENPHKTFIELYSEEFQKRFERPYFFQGAKDGASVKRLLDGSKKSPQQLVEIVKEAWKRMHLFGCKRSNTISGFMSAYNEILHEIETGQPSDKLPPLGAPPYVRGTRPPSPPQSNGWNADRFRASIGLPVQAAAATQ